LLAASAALFAVDSRRRPAAPKQSAGDTSSSAPRNDGQYLSKLRANGFDNRQAKRPIELLERRMLEMINQDRLASPIDVHRPVTLLRWDEKLAQIARAHCEDMLQRSFFNHVNPDGLSPVERLSNAGIAWSSLGENIARNHDNLSETEAAFMRSSHRHNILNPAFTHVGVGIVRLTNGALYVTQLFVQEP
jgi:uncharacterized protein YkwD